MLSPTEIAILIRVAASIASSMIQKGGSWALEAMSAPEQQEALKNCVLVGLAALLEEGVAGEDREGLEQVSEAVEHFFRYPEPNVLLMDLLQGKPIDTAELMARFAEGASPERLPQLDPEEGFAAFLEAFERQAIGEPAFAGVIEVGHTVEQTRLKRREVEAEVRQAEALKELPEALETARRKGKREEQREVVEEALRRYLSRFRRKWQNLPLAALGGEESSGEEVTLDQVYVALHTTHQVPETKMGKGGSEAERLRPDRTRPFSALEAAASESRLVLLGDPGSGKSTFVRALLSDYAAARIAGTAPPAGLPPHLVPVLLELRELSGRLSDMELHGLTTQRRGERLARAVRDQVAADLEAREAVGYHAGLQEAWAEGACLLVLDGLDEVPPAMRSLVREAVAAACREDHLERVIVTCRVRSYSQDEKLEGFRDFTLAPFDRGKITEFSSIWYQAQRKLGRFTAKEAESRGKDLAAAALAPELNELARNPMLLTTMALIHQNNARLPSERVSLYDQAVKNLLLRWQEQTKGREGLEDLLNDERKLRRILERLAFEAQHVGGTREEERGGLPRETLLGLLEQPEFLGDAGRASRFLDYVDHRAGLLVGHGGRGALPASYGFPHRTFQEYLAGCHLIGQRNRVREYLVRAGEGDLWALAAELGAEALLHVRDAGNDLKDLAYGLCPVAAPDSEKERRALLWSGKMAALVAKEELERDLEIPDGGPAYLKRLIPRLQQLLGTGLPAQERAEVGRALAALGDPRREVLEVDAMELCWVPAGSFVMGSGEDDPDALDDEKPQQEVDLPYGYWLARYPVTQAQFREFVDDGGYEHGEHWVEAEAVGRWDEGKVRHWGGDVVESEPHRYGERFEGANQPVVGVNWWEGLAFCRWLEERWRSRGWLGEGWGVSLPSEPEWEKVARGGEQVPVSVVRRRIDQSLGAGDDDVRLQANSRPRRRYPWGDDAESERMSCSETGIGSTSAVGCFPEGASPYGCEELSGNVWEWTRSCFEDDPYPADLKERRRREDLSSKAARVLRGGAFYHVPGDVRCSVRNGADPAVRDLDLGFRVVVSPHSSLTSEASDL